MSRRLKNYPDPMLVVRSYGADALRLYLINSPAVRAEPLRFREAGVRDVVKDVMLPWFNAYRFLMQNARQLSAASGAPVSLAECGRRGRASHDGQRNQMDLWVMSSLGSLIHFVRSEMDAYRLFTVVPRLLSFIESLTNWYVRLNRPRLKGAVSDGDWRTALETLADVLLTLSRLMAPFAPFFSEYTYQNLKQFAPDDLKAESVHFLMMPELRDDLVDKSFEAAVARMQESICLGRVARERRNISVKQPLRQCTVIYRDQAVLDDIKTLEAYVKSELNVRNVVYSTREEDFVELRADADGRVLGRKLGKSFASVHKAVKNLSSEEVKKLEATGSVEIEGHKIDAADIKVSRDLTPSLKQQADHLEAASTGGETGLLVLLDLEIDNELEEDGLCREAINRIQKLRKKARLEPEDVIEVFFYTPDEKLASVLLKKAVETSKLLKSPPLLEMKHLPPTATILAREQTEKIGESELELCIVRASLSPSVSRLTETPAASLELAQLAASYLRSRSADCAAHLIDKVKKLRIDDVVFDLKPGYNIFVSTAERVTSGAPP
eukprot:Plantae.Rhodophyta-Purpureofilum_apyrenoidigerum.ctg11373.p1 GENE.Plantae.Rhodophyta-Purpureofilum_apyrenoidigerum.ctg11373~~Plantae.Rhodophyta-Purpureofilum_apyrenoidigerum.ctg11373.p1  ORF type:complete len:562 (-),score=111.21 Plantae.Rhodophyta-Purpureofilum_apyrenoidigerum.ctg11373:245-1903(-)